MVDEVELLDANPTYAHIHMPNGQESTVSVRDLVPAERSDSVIYSDPRMDDNRSQKPQLEVNDSVLLSNKQLDVSHEVVTPNGQNLPRRSIQEEQAPAKYKDFVSC